MNSHLNGPLLRQRRIDASLSRQQAATLLSVGAPTLSRIEAGDTDAQRALSVGALLNLAKALGCTPTDLFLANAQETSSPTTDSTTVAVCPEVLIGLLHEMTTQVSIKDLASAFGTTNAAVRAAAEQANQRLNETGLRIAHRADMYFIAPTRAAEVTRRRATMERTTASRTGIDNGTARVLQQVLDGRLANGRLSANTQASLGLLARLGMVTITERQPEPTEPVRYALDIP